MTMMDLDFEIIVDEDTSSPVPCESEFCVQQFGEHDAQWLSFWSCGCQRYGCHKALARWKYSYGANPSTTFICSSPHGCGDHNSVLTSWFSI